MRYRAILKEARCARVSLVPPARLVSYWLRPTGLAFAPLIPRLVCPPIPGGHVRAPQTFVPFFGGVRERRRCGRSHTVAVFDFAWQRPIIEFRVVVKQSLNRRRQEMA